MNEIEQLQLTLQESTPTSKPTLEELQSIVMETKRKNDERHAKKLAALQIQKDAELKYKERLDAAKTSFSASMSDFITFAKHSNVQFPSQKLSFVPFTEVIKNLKDGYQIVVERDPSCKFVYTPDVADTITQVAKWMSTKEQHTNAFKRGLILRGQCGVGKTALMKAMQDVFAFYIDKEYGSIKTVSATEIMRYEQCSDAYNYIANKTILFIDDLGAEPTDKRVYGNYESPLTDLIKFRYNNRKTTIMSTNKLEVTKIHADGTFDIVGDELEEKYGPRIFDRLKEMCNMLFYSGEQKSYRRK